MKKWSGALILVLIFIARLFFYFSAPIPFKNRDRVRITSKVTSEPVRYEDSQYLKIRGFKVYLPLYPEIGYGDQVVVEGEVDDRSRTLILGSWKLAVRKDLKLKNPKLIKFEETRGVVYKLRHKLLSVYQQSLPEPHSAFVAGVAIGSKSNIPSGFWEALKNSGTAHVVVASGMNVTLVAGFLMSVLVLFLPRRLAVICALFGIWVYTVIAGFDAPIVRAAVMGSITFTAVGLGRVNYAWRALSISAYLMLMARPDWVVDLGFILSFTATASIMFFQKKVEKLLSGFKILDKLGIIREDLITTLSAQIGVAPIMVFAFGRFNLLSPLVNAAVLWTIPFITIIGMIGGILGLLYVPLGQAVLYLTYPLTSWFIMVVNFFA